MNEGPPPPYGLYLHLPFCRARCGYCDFAVVTDRDNAQEEYLSRLLNEIRFWGERIEREPGSLYFGGGTPSRLPLPHWQRLLEALQRWFAFTPEIEITAEGNPESLSDEVLKGWRALGINRISVGVQSFQDRFLSLLDRLHSREGALEALDRIRSARFKNWSLDLIYGLPGQSVADWRRDLAEALRLEPPHLSFYNLILHPNLPTTQKALAAHTPDHEEIQSEMFLSAVETLEQAGYSVYELSNAALPGGECRHNLLYWTGGEWIGMGMSGASRFGGEEFANPASWETYLNLWETVPSSPPIRSRRPSRESALLDWVMLRLRTARGFHLRELEAALGHPPPEAFRSLLADLDRSGHLRSSGPKVALSPKGWLVHSEITTRILRVLAIE
ncbi:MAG: Oxygen-independent coproporphyrinogen-III oxidase-like protein [bacterium]|nr:Oxygen-independent coproporphyrinogen-III oxidase-like protein [bacterium]